MAPRRPVRTLSGIQPSGRLHIGNYLGALKNFVQLQEDHEGYFMVADLHSLTENYEIAEKEQQILSVTAAYLAAGIDPKRSTIFLQSLVPEHSELAWILSTITPLTELERMTQYKDKAQRQKENLNTGLLTYPILMAADILLYRAVVVPVGEDQTQHLELARTVARKFNRRFGETFIPPEPLYTAVPRLMSLADPTRKMSKSEPAGCLFLDDTPPVIERKIARAVTDTDGAKGATMGPGVANLFQLLAAFSPEATVNDFRRRYDTGTLPYRELKETLAHELIRGLAPFQKRYITLMKNPSALRRLLATGSRRARRAAGQTIATVRQKIGLPKAA